MIGEAGARAGDAISGSEARDSLADRLDHAGAGITERLRGIEASQDRSIGGDGPLLAQLAGYLSDEVRSRPCLSEHRTPCELQCHLFGARRYHREMRADQHLAGTGTRSRNLGEFQPACSGALKDLFHSVSRDVQSSAGVGLSTNMRHQSSMHIIEKMV